MVSKEELYILLPTSQSKKSKNTLIDLFKKIIKVNFKGKEIKQFNIVHSNTVR